MIYVTSDIHGCYQEYLKLLETINFSDEDTLYVLGDVIDRGEDPVKVLQHMRQHKNIIPLMGNHEYLCLFILPKLLSRMSKEEQERVMTDSFMNYYKAWMEDGGNTTVEKFKEIPLKEQQELLNYMSTFALHKCITVNNRCFVLAHASVGKDCIDPDLDKVSLEDLLFNRPDYSYQYFTEKTLIVGHTPTVLLDSENPGMIFHGKKLLNIDTGCVYGFGLSAICLETHMVTLVINGSLEVEQFKFDF